VTGKAFYDLAVQLGYDFFTGVPDSTLGALFAVLEAGERGYVSAVREDIAIGLAVGAYLGGRTPIVLMQNSGLGNCLNALTSLACLYKIPVLIVVGWRGADENDAPEHQLMGKATTDLLRAISLPFWIPTQHNLQELVVVASEQRIAERTPCALLIREQVFA